MSHSEPTYVFEAMLPALGFFIGVPLTFYGAALWICGLTGGLNWPAPAPVATCVYQRIVTGATTTVILGRKADEADIKAGRGDGCISLLLPR